MTDLFRLKVVFYKTGSGNEPVREWLQDLTRAEKKNRLIRLMRTQNRQARQER